MGVATDILEGLAPVNVKEILQATVNHRMAVDVTGIGLNDLEKAMETVLG